MWGRVAVALLALTVTQPKTIIDLQPFRQETALHLPKEGLVTLVNLNPNINVWFLLRTQGNDWHLENPDPRGTRLSLDAKTGVLNIADGNKQYACNVFDSLEQARTSRLIYYPLCDGRLYLRNPAKGNRTALEAATEFLRDQVWGGEKVIVLFHHLLSDRYRETGETSNRNLAQDKPVTTDQPLPALIDSQRSRDLLTPVNLAIALESQSTSLLAGSWYPAAGNPGIYVSVMQPNFADPSVFRNYRTSVNNLDTIEASSLCYLVAFDLDRFDLGYALGTEHPAVNWSARTLDSMRDSDLPGPDGIGTAAPLVSTGLIRPDEGRKTVATFIGGFKRTHGAFHYGDLALKNHGSHYGFISNGVVFSQLQPGLATLLVRDTGAVELKTWTQADNQSLSNIRHARQNGVPLIDSGIPGSLVNRWGPGNWSGSEDEKLRTIRSGVAYETVHGKHFLIYAVFSDATPSAMARVFQAYQVNYAMLLDMNALEHTYMAVYRRSGNEMSVDHLLSGMSQLDKSVSGEVVPRFLGFPDNRDFFYVMRKNVMPENAETKP